MRNFLDKSINSLASLLFPGLGQAFDGRFARAGFFIIAIATTFLLFIPICYIFWAWNVVDAYKGTKKLAS